MEIKLEPYKSVTFKSHLRYESAEKFLRVIGSGSPPGVPSRTKLFWANGILFRQFSLPPTDSIVAEKMKGNLIWDHIEYTTLPQYQSELQASPERPLVTIFVVDVTGHIVFDPLTKWIKENLL